MIEIENMQELKNKLPLEKDLDNRRWQELEKEIAYNKISIDNLKKKNVNFDKEISEYTIEQLEEINMELGYEQEELDKLIEIVTLIDEYIFGKNSIWKKNSIVKEIIDKTRMMDGKYTDTDYKSIIVEFLEKYFLIVNAKNLVETLTDREGMQDSIYYYLAEAVEDWEDLTTSNLLIDSDLLENIVKEAKSEKENCINSCIVYYEDIEEEEKTEIKKEFAKLFDEMIEKVENSKEKFDFRYYVYNLL